MVKYLIIDKRTRKQITDAEMHGGDSYIKRHQAVQFIPFRTDDEIRNNLILIKVGSKSKGITVNEVWDEYEFRKYGRRRGKWLK